MSRDIPQSPDFPADEALDAQVLGSLITLGLALIFCAGVAFGVAIT